MGVHATIKVAVRVIMLVVFFFANHASCLHAIIKKETEEDSGGISTHPFKNDIKASVGCIGILPEVLDWYLQQPVLTCHLHAV